MMIARYPLGLSLPAWAGVIAAALGLAASAWLPPLALAALLGAAVLVSVYLAEELAHALGEPFGALALAVAITVIEVGLVLSMMLVDPPGTRELARDTVFSALMIVLNGIVGVCLTVGGSRHHEQSFAAAGVSTGLAMIATLAGLTLVLPNFTLSTPGPYYNTQQLGFVAAASLGLYALYVYGQTLRHRDYFTLGGGADNASAHAGNTDHPAPRLTLIVPLLLVGLAATVLLAKALSPTLKRVIFEAGYPAAALGVAIALLVLLPEGLAAARAARRNDLQRSMNLAIGSALATIGLTIPAVALIAAGFALPVALGLPPKEIALLTLTLLVSALSLTRGTTTVLHGAVHLAIFGAFVFVTLIP